MTHVFCTGSRDQAQQLVRVRKKRISEGKKINSKGNCNVLRKHKELVKEITLDLSIRCIKFLINLIWIDEKAKQCTLGQM